MTDAELTALYAQYVQDRAALTGKASTALATNAAALALPDPTPTNNAYIASTNPTAANNTYAATPLLVAAASAAQVQAYVRLVDAQGRALTAQVTALVAQVRALTLQNTELMAQARAGAKQRNVLIRFLLSLRDSQSDT